MRKKATMKVLFNAYKQESEKYPLPVVINPDLQAFKDKLAASLEQFADIDEEMRIHESEALTSANSIVNFIKFLDRRAADLETKHLSNFALSLSASLKEISKLMKSRVKDNATEAGALDIVKQINLISII